MNSLCYIVGAADSTGADFSQKGFLIAADGGYRSLTERGIRPDLVLGDFDSLGFVPKEEKLLVFPSQKDDTDLAIAVEEGRRRGYTDFVLYGGIGGRIDHTFANVQLLSALAGEHCRGFLLGEGTVMTVIRNGEWHFSAENRGYCSVFSLSEQSRGVTEEGLKYALCDATLDRTVPLGVSNEFCCQPARIAVTDGELLLVWFQSPADFMASFS